MAMHSRIQLTTRFRCEEKKVGVDTFACDFEDIEFYYEPKSNLLTAEIPVLCPKCGKIHFLQKTVLSQEIKG